MHMKNIIRVDSKIHFPNFSCCLIFVCVMLSSCTGINKMGKMPEDFDFVATYGIAEENTINTFDNTFTKKIDWNKDTTITLYFPYDEKEKVYKKIKRYELEKMPEDFKPESKMDVSSAPTYCLKFRIDDSIHKVKWETNTLSKEREARRLRSIYEQVNDYLNEDTTITSLPEDKRGAF